MGRLAEAIRELRHLEPGKDTTVTETQRAMLGAARVGHYQLTREIDAGGMGFVYEAIQDQPRRTVAVKLMRHSLSSKAAIRRFEYESQILARLQHPGIAQIFEAGTHQHGELAIPYFAMELVPGARPITTYASAQKLSLRQRLELFIQVCDAVHHAHRKGILHRDLKPQNILIDMNGRVKVIDFGIARAVDADQVPATLQTSPDQLLGTLQYMSPEQLAGDPRELDARTDVYALGVVLYELLCDKPPYDLSASRIPDASRIIREQQPLRPRVANVQLSADLETILLKALHKDRSRRYQTAQELLDDLRRTLGGEPVSARRDSATYVVGTRLRAALARHPVGSILLAAVAALLIAELVGGAVDDLLGISRWFEKVATVHMSSFPEPALPNVRMIAMGDATDRSVVAHEAGIDPALFGDFRWMRSATGEVLHRLSNAGARAVVLDFFYEAPTSEAIDQKLLSGVDALAAKGVDVVAAVSSWEMLQGEHPRIFDALASRLRWGVASGGSGQPDSPWCAHLGLRHQDADAYPGLALSAYAAARSPGAPVRVSLNTTKQRVELHYAPPNGSAFGETVPATLVGPVAGDDANSGIRSTDVAAESIVAMPPQPVLNHSTFDIADVLQADDGELGRRFKGMVVVICGQFAGRDAYSYADGRTLFGSQIQAVAIDSLLRGAPIRRTPILEWGGAYCDASVLMELLLAATGAAAGALAEQRRRVALSVALPLLLALAVVAGSLLLYRQQRVLYSPWVPALCALTSFALARMVRRCAPLHRM
jgi:hypothetical protein